MYEQLTWSESWVDEIDEGEESSCGDVESLEMDLPISSSGGVGGNSGKGGGGEKKGTESDVAVSPG